MTTSVSQQRVTSVLRQRVTSVSVGFFPLTAQPEACGKKHPFKEIIILSSCSTSTEEKNFECV
jgi:hypothetical protein